ncbi:sugar transferase [Pedobacter sp.]|uniref:sugar transferase n=1 Tax=Pedobacter sp. TaxID=1411316 RepID=UPI003D7F2792
MYREVFKRLLDIFISSILFILLSPVFLTLVLLLTIANRGKPFFFQRRPGKNGKIFRIIKFRTMTSRRNGEGELLCDAERVTKLGSFIRHRSLDEIPQLLNVIKGEMSLVGPRPLLPEYLPLYNSFQKRRHEVKPGITGWAQVNGRNAISWKQKFDYDVHYVEHLSFRLDLHICWLTLTKVIRRADINQSGQATTIYFTGNQETQIRDQISN